MNAIDDPKYDKNGSIHWKLLKTLDVPNVTEIHVRIWRGILCYEFYWLVPEASMDRVILPPGNNKVKAAYFFDNEGGDYLAKPTNPKMREDGMNLFIVYLEDGRIFLTGLNYETKEPFFRDLDDEIARTSTKTKKKPKKAS